MDVSRIKHTVPYFFCALQNIAAKLGTTCYTAFMAKYTASDRPDDHMRSEVEEAEQAFDRALNALPEGSNIRNYGELLRDEVYTLIASIVELRVLANEPGNNELYARHCCLNNLRRATDLLEQGAPLPV